MATGPTRERPWQIRYYLTDSGACPARDFIREQDVFVQALIRDAVARLSRGETGRNEVEYMGRGGDRNWRDIYALRITDPREVNQYRIYYAIVGPHTYGLLVGTYKNQERAGKAIRDRAAEALATWRGRKAAIAARSKGGR